MCGIAGVFGYNAVLKTMLITLSQLERGVLGTGIAYINNGLKILKEPIHPITFFKKHIRFIVNNNSRIAISHNRHPSRGNVCYYNTHPFLECKKRFALIHNGSIMFTKEFRDMVITKHKILGETDSEILTHLLEEEYEECRDMVQALKALSYTVLSGAIIVLDKNGKMYATRRGYNPLYYGISGTNVYLSSKRSSIQLFINKVGVVQKLYVGEVLEVHNGKVFIHGKREEVEEVENEFIEINLNNQLYDINLFGYGGNHEILY